MTFKQYHPDFVNLIGRWPRFSLLLSSDGSSRNPFFYNGCTYLPELDELYVTSDLLQSTSSSKLPIILISRIPLSRSEPISNSGDGRSRVSDVISARWMKLRPPSSMPMPAGAIPYKKGVLFCSQGTLDAETGGLWYMPTGKPPVAILTSFFGRPFNSIQSVARAGDGSLWFVDSAAGFEQDIRPKPQLPNQVYRFDLKTGDLRVVADGFRRPMGIALTPDGRTVYVTDTEAARPDGIIDPALLVLPTLKPVRSLYFRVANRIHRAATIYAFDVIERSGSPFLANRRVFAYASMGAPTTVRCDVAGNVYASCGDGLEVWNPGGVALGLIEVPGTFSSS